MASADDSSAANDTAATPTRQDALLEALQYKKALEHIASLAPELSETQLRVLLRLTATALEEGATSIRTSSRALEKDKYGARRNVQTALDKPSPDRGHIVPQPGNTNTGTRYRLAFLEVTVMGGAVTTPPTGEGGAIMTPPARASGATTTPGVALKQRQRWRHITTPPPIEKHGIYALHATVLDRDSDSIKTLDRVLSAKAANAPRDQLQEFAEILQVYSERLGRVYEKRPDVECCAQLIAACGTKEGLHALIFEVDRTRQQPGESPMWWVTVALQKFHDIPAKVTAARRTELKAAKRPALVRRTRRLGGAYRYPRGTGSGTVILL